MYVILVKKKITVAFLYWRKTTYSSKHVFAREYRPNSQRKRSLRLVGKRKISNVKGERLRTANPPKVQKFFYAGGVKGESNEGFI